MASISSWHQRTICFELQIATFPPGIKSGRICTCNIPGIAEGAGEGSYVIFEELSRRGDTVLMQRMCLKLVFYWFFKREKRLITRWKNLWVWWNIMYTECPFYHTNLKRGKKELDLFYHTTLWNITNISLQPLWLRYKGRFNNF